MAEYNFRKDLVVGEEGEVTVKDVLVSKGRKFIHFNKDNKYDLKMEDESGVEFTYEIKTDVYCTPIKDTGNIYVEVESWNRESGIMVCEADWFAYYYKNLKQIWFIKMDKLKELIENYKYDTSKMRLSQFGGDKGSNTKGYLIKREALKDYFYVHYI